jgi:nucleotide-binding universal stress UspA family protein
LVYRKQDSPLTVKSALTVADAPQCSLKTPRKTLKNHIPKGLDKRGIMYCKGREAIVEPAKSGTHELDEALDVAVRVAATRRGAVTHWLCLMMEFVRAYLLLSVHVHVCAVSHTHSCCK